MSIESNQDNVQKMTWEYFQLLAQQRVSHFNLFIVFIGAIFAVYVLQIGNGLQGNIVSCVLSLIEIFLCFIFHKIDLRNKFLIKHTEKILMQLEENYDDNTPKIFISEKESTEAVRNKEKTKLYCFRQLSTSQLYNLFYIVFFCIGCLTLVLSFLLIIVQNS